MARKNHKTNSKSHQPTHDDLEEQRAPPQVQPFRYFDPATTSLVSSTLPPTISSPKVSKKHQATKELRESSSDDSHDSRGRKCSKKHKPGITIKEMEKRLQAADRRDHESAKDVRGSSHKLPDTHVAPSRSRSRGRSSDSSARDDPREEEKVPASSIKASLEVNGSATRQQSPQPSASSRRVETSSLPSNPNAIAFATSANQSCAQGLLYLPSVCVYKEPADQILLFASQLLACTEDNPNFFRDVLLLHPLCTTLSLGLTLEPQLWLDKLLVSLQVMIPLLPITEASIAIKLLAEFKKLRDEGESKLLLNVLGQIIRG